MQLNVMPAERRVGRPWYGWLGAIVAVLTGIGAVPVGIMFITDPTGKALQLPAGWIEATPFGTYLVPGLHLLAINGVAMFVLAALIVRRHWVAPWLTAILGVGLIIWILVEIVVMPETMFLTWIYLGLGLLLGFVALFWLRRTGQLRLW